MSIECSKCTGTGFLRHYAHRDNGRCFSCGGSGQVEASSVRQPVRRVAVDQTRYAVVSLEEGTDLPENAMLRTDNLAEARAFCRSFARPHADGLRFTVLDGATVLARGSVNEAGCMVFER